eukprot:3991184-Prymnesium_polylepis.1
MVSSPDGTGLRQLYDTNTLDKRRAAPSGILDVETRLSITNTINAVRTNLYENQSAAPSLLLAAVAAEMGLADEL